MTERGTVLGRFFVPGRCRTKGSLKPQPMRRGGKLVIHMEESSSYSKPWKEWMIKVIVTEGKKGNITLGYDEPVAVMALFLFEPTIGVNGEVYESHLTPYPTSGDIGDLDKLLRNLLDALTQSGMIEDDRLVMRISSEKRWCGAGEKAGVEVQVSAA